MQDHLAPKIEQATRQQFPAGIEAYGADALRFTFAALATTGRDIRFDLGRIDGYRNFCNKLWNAARYVLANTDSSIEGDVRYTAADRWIRARFAATVRDVHRQFADYRLDLVAQAIYEFTWHEFCDWYLEFSKPVLQSNDAPLAEQNGTRRTLLEVLEALLRLLHPIMPFITEEIWQQLAPRARIDRPTIMLEAYPRENDFAANDDEAAADIEWVRQVILGVRQIRGEMNIAPGKPLPVLFKDARPPDLRRASLYAALLSRLGRIESVRALNDVEEAPPAATALVGDLRLLVPLKGIIDIDAERARLEKQQAKLKGELAKAHGKLANARFVANAPAAVVRQEQDRASEFNRQLEHLDEQLSKLASYA
jgi:valyl-tRNA synthetase